MSDIFLSYKREDEARAGAIGRALNESGFDVWWDRGLPGGESWRANIEKELHGARCVVVLWSRASVAPEGHFVRDEAGRALAKGLLVPVRIDNVVPPVGFGEIQCLDLIRWRGRIGDPFFQDVVRTVRAKIDGKPAPRPVGPTLRRWRRMGWGGGTAVLASLVAALAANVGGIATAGCTLAAMQPGLSDTCGALRIGGRPTHAERLFWLARRPGNCEDLRRYIERYHAGGAYVAEADALLAARRATMETHFAPATHLLPLYVMQADTAAAAEAASRAKALARAKELAADDCRAFAQTTLFKFETADVEAQHWRCETIGGKVACSLEGQSLCRLEERRDVERETCGK